MSLTFIIVSYNMVRELPRTVLSCLPPYQNYPKNCDVKVIIVDNGSDFEITEAVKKSWPENVQYVLVPSPNSSPVKAVNLGMSLVETELACILIDGARMLSPGIVCSAHDISLLSKNPFIATLGYHLGHKLQQNNPQHTQAVEDELLLSINWPHEPERLYEISCLSGTSKAGILNSASESNAFILKTDFFHELGGYDQRFTSPGGGMANLDFFKRAVESPLSQYFLLAEEGSFHQVHGGVSTSPNNNKKISRKNILSEWKLEYKRIRGFEFSPSNELPVVFGEMHDSLLNATVEEVRRRKKIYRDSLLQN